MALFLFNVLENVNPPNLAPSPSAPSSQPSPLSLSFSLPDFSEIVANKHSNGAEDHTNGPSFCFSTTRTQKRKRESSIYHNMEDNDCDKDSFPSHNGSPLKNHTNKDYDQHPDCIHNKSTQQKKFCNHNDGYENKSKRNIKRQKTKQNELKPKKTATTRRPPLKKKKRETEREYKLRRGRVAAKHFREKQKQIFSDLTAEVERRRIETKQLRTENNILRQENQNLMEEVKYLRSSIREQELGAHPWWIPYPVFGASSGVWFALNIFSGDESLRSLVDFQVPFCCELFVDLVRLISLYCFRIVIYFGVKDLWWMLSAKVTNKFLVLTTSFQNNKKKNFTFWVSLLWQTLRHKLTTTPQQLNNKFMTT